MTANSIAYARAQEEARHNVTSEYLENKKIEETKRHNKATESIDTYKGKETERHNRVQENIGYVTANISASHYQVSDTEIVRHNTALEMINSASVQETQRHNQVMEHLETEQQSINRSAVGAQYLSAQAAKASAAAAATNAAANMRNAATNAAAQQLRENEAMGLTGSGAASILEKNAHAELMKSQAGKTEVETGIVEPKAASEIFKNYVSPLSGIVTNLTGLLAGE